MVTGAGSTWTNTADLFVGFNGSGTLTVADQGIVEASNIQIAAGGSGSLGILNIGAAAGDAAINALRVDGG